MWRLKAEKIVQFSQSSYQFTFRLHHGHVFEPQNKAEISAVREWLKGEITAFNDQSPLWLGFEMPRFCDGTGRIVEFLGHSTDICKDAMEMNSDIFPEGKPNYVNYKFCTLNINQDEVLNFPCYSVPLIPYGSFAVPNFDHIEAYAVCELNLAGKLPARNFSNYTKF